MGYKSDSYLKVQLRMGEWLDKGLPMPIDNINYGKSRDLLNKLIGREYKYGDDSVTDEQLRHLEAMLGPNGYTYYRVLLEQVGGFDMEKDCISYQPQGADDGTK